MKVKLILGLVLGLVIWFVANAQDAERSVDLISKVEVEPYTFPVGHTSFIVTCIKECPDRVLIEALYRGDLTGFEGLVVRSETVVVRVLPGARMLSDSVPRKMQDLIRFKVTGIMDVGIPTIVLGPAFEVLK